MQRGLRAAGGGRLVACDIQQTALDAAKARLRGASDGAEDAWAWSERVDGAVAEERWLLDARDEQLCVEWRLGCHVDMLRALPDACARLVVFNCGYLPGADKSVVTDATTTVRALREAERVVCAGGTVSVTLYPGHEEGMREEAAVLAHATDELVQDRWSVYHHVWLNQRNKRTGLRAPSLVLLQRLH